MDETKDKNRVLGIIDKIDESGYQWKHELNYLRSHIESVESRGYAQGLTVASEHWPERYETARGRSVTCECGWASEPYKPGKHSQGDFEIAIKEWQKHVISLSLSGS